MLTAGVKANCPLEIIKTPRTFLKAWSGNHYYHYHNKTPLLLDPLFLQRRTAALRRWFLLFTREAASCQRRGNGRKVKLLEFRKWSKQTSALRWVSRSWSSQSSIKGTWVFRLSVLSSSASMHISSTPNNARQEHILSQKTPSAVPRVRRTAHAHTQSSSSIVSSVGRSVTSPGSASVSGPRWNRRRRAPSIVSPRRGRPMEERKSEREKRDSFIKDMKQRTSFADALVSISLSLWRKTHSSHLWDKSSSMKLRGGSRFLDGFLSLFSFPFVHVADVSFLLRHGLLPHAVTWRTFASTGQDETSYLAGQIKATLCSNTTLDHTGAAYHRKVCVSV